MKYVRGAFFVLAGLVVAAATLIAGHTYRLNVCSFNSDVQLMVIQSKADAIDAAKKWVIKDHFFHFEELGAGGEGFLRAIGQTPKCCSATSFTTMFGVVVWEVFLAARQSDQNYEAMMSLTRCGELLSDNKGKITVPIERKPGGKV